MHFKMSLASAYIFALSKKSQNGTNSSAIQKSGQSKKTAILVPWVNTDL